MEMAEYLDFVHTGPGTLAGRYLRMFWQPVYRVKDLPPGKAMPVKIMSEEFTLYRGEGGDPHLVAFRCAHRGTQLNTGWVEGDTIRCRYHGWRFDETGQCVEQPGEEEGFASRVKIRSYPVKEYLGLIFAYLGEGEPPPLRRYPELEKPGVFETNTPEYWPCNYFNRLDNACDGFHVAYTHRESGMRAKRPERLGIRTLNAEETEYGVKTTYFLGDQPPVELRFHMPNTNQTRSFLRVESSSAQDAAKLVADRLFWRMPVDDESCVSFVVDLVPVTGKDAEIYNRRRLEAREAIKGISPNELASRILAGKLGLDEIDLAIPIYYLFWIEDYVVQVGQSPVAPRAEDILGKLDRGVLLMRKLWERELKALSEERPLKPWKSPAEFSTQF